MEDEVNQEKYVLRQFGRLLIPLSGDDTIHAKDMPDDSIALDQANQSQSGHQSLQSKTLKDAPRERASSNKQFDQFFTAYRDKNATLASDSGDVNKFNKFKYNQELMDNIYDANPEAFHDTGDAYAQNPYAQGYDQGYDDNQYYEQ